MTTKVDRRNDLLPIRDQGRRGTCVAFAMTAGHELLDGGGSELSVEFLHWGAKQRDSLPNSADGTTLAAAALSLTHLGQPLELAWPYDDQRDQRAPLYRPSDAAVREALARQRRVGDSLDPSSEAIRAALVRGNVVALGITLFSTWHYLRDGASIEMPPASAVALGGHAVLTIGFEDGEEPSDRVFIVRNSWGSDWGEDGYGYLPFAYVDAHAVAAWVVESSWDRA